MTQPLKELKQKLSELTSDEKAHLATYLLESLEPVESGDIEEAWRLAAEARLAEVESGKAKTFSADEVFSELDRHLP